MRSALIISCCLFLGVATCNASNFKAPNRGPIVQESNPYVTTHYLYAGNIAIGVSDLGGGYVNYFSVPGSENIASAQYGKGWQGSIRDHLHSGRYNPTQAGFMDNAGAPVIVNNTVNKISIPPFQMALFGDPVYDFTQHEDLVKDYSGYKDSGRLDKDGIDESGKSQDAELRSEFDYQGHYENVSNLTSQYDVSAIKHIYRNTYVRSPNAIKQFGPSAILESGEPVYKPSRITTDVSKLLPGNQTTSAIDLSGVVFTAYGIRIKTSAGFNFGMWHDGAKWNSVNKSSFDGRGNEKKFQINESSLEPRNNKYKKLNNNLLILSKGTSANSSAAIGIYAPNSNRNKYQLIGRDGKTGDIEYSEDRRTLSLMMFSHVTSSQLGIRTRYFLTGLMAPNRGKNGHVEGVRHETYILYGTPENILRAISQL